MFPASNTPEEGGGEGVGLLPGTDGIALALPAGCGTVDPSSAPLGLTPCWAGPASTPTHAHPLPQSIMASSISKNNLCMGTLPSSFTP